MSEPKPCKKDDMWCECKQCDEYWEWMAEQEKKDDYIFPDTKEFDEEHERELAEFYGLDGW